MIDGERPFFLVRSIVIMARNHTASSTFSSHQESNYNVVLHSKLSTHQAKHEGHVIHSLVFRTSEHVMTAWTCWTCGKITHTWWQSVGRIGSRSGDGWSAWSTDRLFSVFCCSKRQNVWFYLIIPSVKVRHFQVKRFCFVESRGQERPERASPLLVSPALFCDRSSRFNVQVTSYFHWKF